MPTRTPWPGNVVTGEEATSPNVNNIPGGWIGYAKVTASQASISTEVALTGLSVAVTVPAGRMLKVSAKCQILDVVEDLQVLIHIKEGATYLQRHQISTAGMSGDVRATMLPWVLIDGPSAGTHTYFLTMEVIGGGTMNMEAGTEYPAFILVEDLGPSSA